MRAQVIPVLLFAVAALAGAVGQLLYKRGADAAGGSVASYFNLPILAGVVCYVSVMVLFVAAFKRGGEPAVLYPVYASTFVWAALISWWLGGPAVRPVHVAGMLCLVAGMYLMGRSG
ncbi:MAG: hypothetical protein AAF743_02250 [Planctomycetota bacterium]